MGADGAGGPGRAGLGRPGPGDGGGRCGRGRRPGQRGRGDGRAALGRAAGRQPALAGPGRTSEPESDPKRRRCVSVTHPRRIGQSRPRNTIQRVVNWRMAACPKCGQENPDRFRVCGMCGEPLPADDGRAREVRKTVTIVFCDVVDSTSLADGADPEVVRDVMSRFFVRVREVVERHGGTLEKFIGAAAMAVFGVPTVHEDDALRAVRAAVEVRDALVELQIPARIGVNTGEVVAHPGDNLVTGDAVNVAARLEQRAPAGDVLIGDATLQLVKDAVAAEPIPPLVVKGKSAPVPAWRLASVTDAASGFVRRLDMPI